MEENLEDDPSSGSYHQGLICSHDHASPLTSSRTMTEEVKLGRPLLESVFISEVQKLSTIL